MPWKAPPCPLYTGVKAYRVDEAVSGQPSDGCSVPISGTPVYQPIWVINYDTSWKELGTGHQCNDTYRYWYWGYGTSSGTFTLLGYQHPISNGSSHTFEISRVYEGREMYEWFVDGVEKKYLYSSWTGNEVEVGLESYASGANVVEYLNSSLKYQLNDGTFQNWAGQDGSRVDSNMCGNWSGATAWYSGQGTQGCR